MRDALVFVIWQSDEQQAQEAVWNAAMWCCEQLSVKDELSVSPDRDTRSVTGAVSIDQTILRRIEQADAVIVDVSTVGWVCRPDGDGGLVGSSTAEDGKALPNANAMVELGYALGVLGETRMILVKDRRVPGDLPFDLKTRSVIFFEDERHLRKRLKPALNAVLQVSDGPPGTPATRERLLLGLHRCSGAKDWPALASEIELLARTPGDVYDLAAGFFRSYDVAALGLPQGANHWSYGVHVARSIEQDLRRTLLPLTTATERESAATRLRQFFLGIAHKRRFLTAIDSRVSAVAYASHAVLSPHQEHTADHRGLIRDLLDSLAGLEEFDVAQTPFVSAVGAGESLIAMAGVVRLKDVEPPMGLIDDFYAAVSALRAEINRVDPFDFRPGDSGE